MKFLLNKIVMASLSLLDPPISILRYVKRLSPPILHLERSKSMEISIHAEESNPVIEKLRAELDKVKLMNENMIQNNSELEILYEHKNNECDDLANIF